MSNCTAPPRSSAFEQDEIAQPLDRLAQLHVGQRADEIAKTECKFGASPRASVDRSLSMASRISGEGIINMRDAVKAFAPTSDKAGRYRRRPE
jgi:hypothetical protein